VSAAHRNVGARDLTIAGTLAADRAEALKAEPRATLASGQDVVDGRPVRFERTWTVEPDIPFPGLTTVTVTVRSLRATPERPAGSVTLRFVRAL